MRAGQLNQRVTVQQLAAGQDALGQPVQTWSTVCTVWAHIRYSSGMEAVKANQDASLVKASIRLRWRTGINAGMRVTHGSTVYEISAVLPDAADKRHLDLVCEVVNAVS